MTQYKYVLEEKDLPSHWYNIQSDMKAPLPPPRHPVTLEPVGPDDIAPLFPMALIMQEVDALWVGRPNNPTGNIVSKEYIYELAKQFPDKWFIVDEAFIQFVDDWAEKSLLIETPPPNILVLHSLTKFYALAGQKAWKLNMASGQPAYTLVPMPAKIYEMDTTTVPASYSASFSRQVAAFGLDRVTWGVALPEQTANAIVRLIQNRDAGDLVIMPSGEVLLK